MHTPIRPFALAFAALLTFAGCAEAHGRQGGRGGYGPGGHHGHGHTGWRHDGPFRGGLGIGIGIGIGLGFSTWHAVPLYPVYALPLYAPVEPGHEIASPPAATPAAAEPAVLTREGRSPGQTEADRRACDRWAMSRPSAMADAAIFHRTALACMQDRGYTLR